MLSENAGQWIYARMGKERHAEVKVPWEELTAEDRENLLRPVDALTFFSLTPDAENQFFLVFCNVAIW